MKKILILVSFIICLTVISVSGADGTETSTNGVASIALTEV